MTKSDLFAPLYLGLFAAQLSAIACNAFLDIGYGSFEREMLFWSFIFAVTLYVGWGQSRKPTALGSVWQKGVLFFGLALFVLVFLPLWGLPRAGLYLLAMLQASYNCITSTKRHLHLGLLVSLALVLFAASHLRADWTMLFYLVPYMAAAVFTLVGEQIHSRENDLLKTSLGRLDSKGQVPAILAATAAILFIGGSLYLLTPQVNWPYLEWRFGQQVLRNPGGDIEQDGGGAQTGADKPDNGGKAEQNQGLGGGKQPVFLGGQWPSPQEMRVAAQRQHMPRWQAAAINRAADFSESAQQVLQPVLIGLFDWWEWLKRWLREHWFALLLGLLALILVVLLIALRAWIREIPWVIWLLSRWDYVNLGLFGRHTAGEIGARQYYRAMERLFTLTSLPRAATANTREYLTDIRRRHREDVQRSATELTRLFERARYAGQPIDEQSLLRMRHLYRQLYRLQR